MVENGNKEELCERGDLNPYGLPQGSSAKYAGRMLKPLFGRFLHYGEKIKNGGGGNKKWKK